MKKLKLELDELAVTSFDTAPERRKRGTVVGHDTDATVCWGLCGSFGDTCPGCTYDCQTDVCGAWDTEDTYCGQRTCDATRTPCMTATDCWTP